MLELLDKSAENYLGTVNLLDMILSRGAGEFEWNYDNPAETGWIGQRFICQRHIEELGTQWEKYIFNHFKRKGTQKVCSIPPPFSQHLTLTAPRNTYVVEKEEAKGVLFMDHVLLHIGLPVCATHKEELKRYRAQLNVEETGHVIHPPVNQGRFSQTPDITADIQQYGPTCSQTDDPSYFPPNERNEGPSMKKTPSTVSSHAKSAFSNFIKTIGLEKVMRRKDFGDLGERSQRRKAQLLRDGFSIAYEIVAPDGPQELKQMVISTELEGLYERRRTDRYEALMMGLKSRFLAASTRVEKLHLLSIVAPRLSLAEVQRYVPGLSEYFYSKAKRLSHRGGQEIKKDLRRQKYDAYKINRFVEFISSFKVAVSLPFGTRTSKLSDGTLIEYPNVLHQHSATEIIELFKRELEESEETHLLMSPATMYRILEACSATRRKSLHGVDFFVAEAMEAFDEAHTIIDGLKADGDVDEFWHSSLKMKLLEAKQYLRTDFKVHVKQNSRVADHCIRHALSDPNSDEFSEPCDGEQAQHSHIHDLICDRCELVKIALGDLLETAKELHESAENASPQKTKFDRILRDVRDIDNRIQELKKHQVRATASEMDRDNIVSSLQIGEALITMDWAMKLLPMFAREKTTDYFAKRGMSWHISHVLAKKNNDNYVQHTFVHIIEGELQDTVALTSLLQHTLRELSIEGIKRVHLRSDNAGCYKSSSTIASMNKISAEINVKIASYFFSEAQAGKSACDRMAAVVKRKIHDFVDSGHDVKNTEEFFNGITTGKPLSGLSVYIRKLENAKASPTKILGISTLNTFVFNDDGIHAYRHSTIGRGTSIRYENMQANFADGTTIRKGGKLPGEADFWATTGKALRLETSHHRATEHADEAEHCKPEDSDSCDSLLHLFRCPEEACTAEFLQSSNLERHLLLGKHKLVPERLTLRDQSLQFYTVHLEGVHAKRIYPDVTSALESLQETNANGKKAAQGWALRARKRSERLPDRSKSYITQLFADGW